MVLYRSEANLEPWSRRWWDRYRVGLSSCSMVVENSQSRIQSVTSMPIPSRLLHDPRVAFQKSELDALSTYDFTLSCRVERAARDGVDANGVDYIDEDNATWSTLSNFASIQVDEDPESGTVEGTYNPIPNTVRSEWDDPGTYDFVRLYMNATTVGIWTGRIRVSLSMFGNYGVWKQDYVNPKSPPVYPDLSIFTPWVSGHATEL